jgi:AcrR family transcriptional regulator
MAADDPPPRQRPTTASRRAVRAQKILDAATTLILRWGYDKTAIDDIAREAGVAKGTLYLHWPTREALFLALLQRERAALAADVAARIAADPQGASLRGMIRHSARALMGRPLLRAALLRDTAIIGKLAQLPDSGGEYVERLEAFRAYLEVLRGHGLVRTDQNLTTQVYLVGAVFAGFMLVAPLMPPELTLPDDALADLMAETIHRTLEVEVAEAGVAPAVQEAVQRYLDRDQAITEAEARLSDEAGFASGH